MDYLEISLISRYNAPQTNKFMKRSSEDSIANLQPPEPNCANCHQRSLSFIIYKKTHLILIYYLEISILVTFCPPQIEKFSYLVPCKPVQIFWRAARWNRHAKIFWSLRPSKWVFNDPPFRASQMKIFCHVRSSQNRKAETSV